MVGIGVIKGVGGGVLSGWVVGVGLGVGIVELWGVGVGLGGSMNGCISGVSNGLCNGTPIPIPKAAIANKTIP